MHYCLLQMAVGARKEVIANRSAENFEVPLCPKFAICINTNTLQKEDSVRSFFAPRRKGIL